MTALFTTRGVCELGVQAALSSLACYGYSKIFPAPSHKYLYALGAVNAVAVRFIMEAASRLADYKSSSDKEKLKLGFRTSLSLSLACTLPIFHRYAGQWLKFQVPDEMTKLYCLSIAVLTVLGTTKLDNREKK